MNIIKKSEFQECFDSYYFYFHKGIIRDYDVSSNFDDYLNDYFKERYKTSFNEFSKLVADYIKGLVAFNDVKFKSNKWFNKLIKAYGVNSKFDIFVTECVSKMFDLTPDYAYFIYYSMRVDVDWLLGEEILSVLKNFSEGIYKSE